MTTSTTTETSATPQASAPQTQVTLGSKIIASKQSSLCALHKVAIDRLSTIVTGANRGIGLGIAECCLSNGAARVYSIDIGESGEEFDTLFTRYPGKFYALKANVSEEATITAAVDQIIVEAGALHGMVVNAGRTHHKAALDFTKEDIENLFNVNLFGAFYAARAAARAFIKLGIKGSVVFTDSMASYRPNKASKPFPIVITPTQPAIDAIKARPFRTLQRLESRCPKHDPYPSHGMGSVRYPREQRFPGTCQHSHDRPTGYHSNQTGSSS
jgi:hypothetical protein